MKLHQKKSYLVAQDEGKALKRKGPKITQLLYILFLLFIFIYIAYFFFARSFYVKTDGLIEVAKQRIAATHGGKIQQFSLVQGSRIKKGEQIAIIAAARYCSEPSPIIDSTKAQLSFKLKDEEIDLSALVKEYALLRKIENQSTPAGDELGIRRALDINAPLLINPLPKGYKLLEKQNEIDIQRLRIANLKERLRLHQAPTIAANNDPSCSSETILAPFDGYVFSTSFVENEVTNRGETIMTIVADDAPVNLEIYVENDLFDSAQPQHTFTVTLPNGTKTKALVSEVFSSAITQSERKFDNYEPVMPMLKAHLVPENKQDIALWKQFDRYSVKVKGKK